MTTQKKNFLQLIGLLWLNNEEVFTNRPNCALLIHNLSKSEINHFGAGGIFELDLSESQIALTPKKERIIPLGINLALSQSGQSFLG